MIYNLLKSFFLLNTLNHKFILKLSFQMFTKVKNHSITEIDFYSFKKKINHLLSMKLSLIYA